MINFIIKPWKTWKLNMLQERQRLSNVKTESVIFEGNSLSLLFFVIAIIKTQLYNLEVLKGQQNVQN